MTNHRLLALALAAVLLLAVSCLGGTPGSSGAEDPRIERLLSQMTLEEKLSLLGGTGFETKAIPRLGIPALTMTDGPVGVRWDSASAFPAGIMMASTWNPALITTLGGALGRETKAKGRRMLLGPCVNIQRTPFGGRNFESFGEDPFLASRLAVAYVRGVQGEHVVATTKHYACNNQEFERDFTNVTVDERTLREIYLPAFEAAVNEGGSLSVMSAYNKVNGAWCSENPHLLTDILKKEWGFRGLVVSDWSATHSVVPTALAGLDLEMPTGVHLNADSLLPALHRGEIPPAVIDDKVRRILRTIIWAGLLDSANIGKGALNTPDHRRIARDVAREGIVLLKNERNVLPLDRSTLTSLAVIGPNAATARTGGGGSSLVAPLYAVTPLEGIRGAVGPAVQVRYAKGCNIEGEVTAIPSSALRPSGGAPGAHGLKGEYFANRTLTGDPVLTRIDTALDFSWTGAPDPSLPPDDFSVRWTGVIVPPKTTTYELRFMSDDGVRVYLDSVLVMEDWTDHAATTRSYKARLEAGRAYSLRVDYYEHSGGAVARLGWFTDEEGLQAEAVRAATNADAAILCVGLNNGYESEGFDRQTLELPPAEVALIKAVAAVAKRTVVVLNSGAPVVMEGWLQSVPALLASWYPGEEGGSAVADVLFGAVNPSGKLPVTFLKRWEDSPAYGNYPGSGGVHYAEGVFVGYRHFDAHNTDVAFPFGFGLSYTSFEFSGLKVTARPGGATVQVDVKNTGSRAGAEVVQVYVHDRQASVPRPLRELKAFQKVMLRLGQKKTVTLDLDRRAFAFYDVATGTWVVEPGEFDLAVGISSRDIRASAVFPWK